MIDVNLVTLIKRVRQYTRDFSGMTFTDDDVTAFLNEGIDRIVEIMPEFAPMVYLENTDQEPLMLPKQYHHLLAVYSASRCFFQDERHYQHGNLMNEFEQKMAEVQAKCESGQLVIKDPDGNTVDFGTGDTDAVVNNYFTPNRVPNIVDEDGNIVWEDLG